MGLINLFKERNGNDVPSLPYRDDQRDALREAYSKLQVERMRMVQWAEAGLECWRTTWWNIWMMMSGIAGEARGILSDIIETPPKRKIPPAARLIAGEAVTVVVSLSVCRQSRTGFLGDEFNQWSAMCAWLFEQATSGDDTRFRELVRGD